MLRRLRECYLPKFSKYSFLNYSKTNRTKVSFAILATIILVSCMFFFFNGNMNEEKDKGIFKLSYDSKKKSGSNPAVVNFDPTQKWQGESAICFTPAFAQGSDGKKIEFGTKSRYRPVFFDSGNEVPSGLDKYEGKTNFAVAEYGSNPTEVSIAIAQKFWEKIEVVVVVPNYENATFAVPLASYLNAPLIYDYEGRHANEVREFINKNKIKNVISVGKNNIYGVAKMFLKTQKDVWDYYLSVLRGGDKCEYIVVTNPTDIDFSNKSRLVPGLSLVSSTLSSERLGIVITCDYSVPIEYNFALGYGTGDAGSGERGEDPDWLPEEEEIALQNYINARAAKVDNAIDDAFEFLTKKGYQAKYVCIVGDTESVPMMYVKSPIWYEGSTDSSESGEEYVASDMYYGDLDIKLNESMTFENSENYYQREDALYTCELAIGRLVARNTLDASALVARSLGYWKYEYKPDDLAYRFALIVRSWAVGMGRLIPPAHQTAVFAENGMLAYWLLGAKAGLQAPSQMPTTNAVMYDGHGYPDGWYVTWASTDDPDANLDRIGTEDVESLDLHAMTVFGACCLSSALDWPVCWNGSAKELKMDADKFFSLGVLHAGAMGYIGATEESWGDFARGTGDFSFCTTFWEDFLGKGIPQGEALRLARERFYFEQYYNEYGRVCVLETVLYGDPAGISYHPGMQVPE